MDGDGTFVVDLVAELREELDKLGVATVDVPDDVEGAVVALTVIPQRLALEPGRCDLFLARQDKDAVEALTPDCLQRAAQLLSLVAKHVSTELSLRARGVASSTHLLRKVEDDGDRKCVVGLCQFDQPPPRLRLDVRRVDDGEATRIESLRSNEVQHLERSVGRLLVVLVVGDERAIGMDWNRSKMPLLMSRKSRNAV